MSDQTALWILCGLFFVALVLVVVTARRGPWSTPKAHESAGVLWLPTDLFDSDNEQLAADLLRALRTGNPSGAPLPEVRIIASGVDPFWGKNPPESWT